MNQYNSSYEASLCLHLCVKHLRQMRLEIYIYIYFAGIRNSKVKKFTLFAQIDHKGENARQEFSPSLTYSKACALDNFIYCFSTSKP